MKLSLLLQTINIQNKAFFRGKKNQMKTNYRKISCTNRTSINLFFFFFNHLNDVDKVQQPVNVILTNS